jgi:membrane protease YdiL (CAAX protease family)
MKRAFTSRGLLPLAWGLTLMFALLPNALSHGLTALTPAWIFLLWTGVAVAGLAWAAVRPLREACILLIVFFLGSMLQGCVVASSFWQSWFRGPETGLGLQLLGRPLPKVGIAAVMLGVLLWLRFHPRELFLARGEPNAPVEPVRGFRIPLRWGLLSGLMTLFSAVILVAIFHPCPSPAALAGALPLLPVVLLAAALNAFAEEVMFRGALLAPLDRAVGQRHAVLLTAVLFGIFHYHGIPSGCLGVVLTTLLGWFWGKCMVETKSLLLPWLMHLVLDALIFWFIAAGLRS